MGNSASLNESVRTAPMVAHLGRGLACAALAACWALAACSSSASQPDGGPICAQGVDSGTLSCDAGACTNGVCVPTCGADGGGCPGGFYCESTVAPFNVCSPITTTDCQSDSDCPVPQTCEAGGICETEEYRADGTSDGCYLNALPDGCSPDSLCYQVPAPNGGSYTVNECIGLSHCSEDGGCPNDPSGNGAACNQFPDGGYIFVGKERLCLSGYCTGQDNCPSGSRCFQPVPGDPLGGCQAGYPGDRCFTYQDCFNSTVGCLVALDGGVDGGEDDGGYLGTCY
jgi:hypothetical protein